MSGFTKAIIGNYKPLFKRKIPPYPLYWKGDPQLRIYLPLFWMKLLKPKINVPNNSVHFEIHPQMTKIDVRNYLEKIYGVSIIDIQVKVGLGKLRNTDGVLPQYVLAKRRFQGVTGVDEDRKYAFVTLANGETFTFPDIMKESPLTKREEEVKLYEEAEKSQKQKNWDRLPLPKWFR